MNTYLEAPNRLDRYSDIDLKHTIFLAGSITGAWNWQDKAKEILLPHFNIFNPRRENFNSLNKEVERKQITWEFLHLDLAEMALFYFSHETLAPITLLEYGKQLVKMKFAPYRKTYVCIHPEYKRKNDVLIQAELERPQLLKNTFFDLDEMYARIIVDHAPKT